MGHLSGPTQILVIPDRVSNYNAYQLESASENVKNLLKLRITRFVCTEFRRAAAQTEFLLRQETFNESLTINGLDDMDQFASHQNK
ncbi:hypothetical protein AYI70_g10383 [Smittium culicis]|uniref:Uncharacterized protein n=1 Tax=Smittium culicis TaxID=133412 RepID=A0A1R1X6X3_9FUNG|nr:hypothetical protein AYI70_g10383 [Smittium culicis]